jgi:hypothetical protein
MKIHPIVQHSPLNILDGLCGGRTCAMVFHYTISEGIANQYYDVMSLYPFMYKYFKFPLGHTKIHVGDAGQDKQAILSKDGLIKCTVLPPKKIYHPVLQLSYNNKLLFCLCKTCAVECKFSGECVHESLGESTLTSTWVLHEVRLAIQKRYKVLEIFEVYEYEVTRYNTCTCEGVQFVDYINKIYKLKAEDRGYPSWVRTSKKRNGKLIIST